MHDALAEAELPLLAAMHLQSARILTPWLLDQHREKVQLVEDPPEGPLLRLGLGEGAGLWARLDPATGFVTWTATRLQLDDLSVEFTTRYSDFRKVGDLVLPHREESAAQSTPTGVLQLEEIILNPAGSELLLVPAGSIGEGGDSGAT